METRQIATAESRVTGGRFLALYSAVAVTAASALLLVDRPTYVPEADDGSGAQDYGSLTGWYALVEDPEPGEYRVSRTVAWQPVAPPADTARALDRAPEPPVTGVLDLVVTVG